MDGVPADDCLQDSSSRRGVPLFTAPFKLWKRHPWNFDNIYRTCGTLLVKGYNTNRVISRAMAPMSSRSGLIPHSIPTPRGAVPSQNPPDSHWPAARRRQQGGRRREEGLGRQSSDPLIFCKHTEALSLAKSKAKNVEVEPFENKIDGQMIGGISLQADVLKIFPLF